MNVAAQQPLDSGDDRMAKVAESIFAVGVLILSIPFILEWGGLASDYWLEGDLSRSIYAIEVDEKRFVADVSVNNFMAGIWVLCGTISMILAPMMLLSKAYLGKTAALTSRLVSVLCVVLTVGVFFELARISLFFSVGHNGNKYMGSHAISAFCIIAMFIVYRVYVARRYNDEQTYDLFFTQLFVAGITPWLFRMGYGIWAMLLGNADQYSVGQQFFVSYSVYLLPMTGVYCFYSFRGKFADLPKAFPMVASVAGLLLLLVGTIGYMSANLTIEMY